MFDWSRTWTMHSCFSVLGQTQEFANQWHSKLRQSIWSDPSLVFASRLVTADCQWSNDPESMAVYIHIHRYRSKLLSLELGQNQEFAKSAAQQAAPIPMIWSGISVCQWNWLLPYGQCYNVESGINTASNLNGLADPIQGVKVCVSSQYSVFELLHEIVDRAAS